MKRPAAALRRPAAAKVKILQTDAEPAGPAPLGTSDVEREVARKEVSLSSTGRKGLEEKSLSTAMTPTSTRRGSRVAECMKRPASKKIPTGKSAMDSSQIVQEPQSASASSAPSMDSQLQKHEPRSAMAPKKKHGREKKMKRPAAKKVVRKPMGTVEEREARRHAVLAIVPAELREEYCNGCSGCRGRAYCTESRRMCLVAAVMPDGHPSAESVVASSSSESVSGESSSTEEEVVEETPPAPLPKASARPPEPPGSPPKGDGHDEDWDRHNKGGGKHRKGRGKSDGKCRFCWKRVKGGPSAMSQHEWWSETCLAWQYYKAGYPWHQAKRMAASLKRQRMEEGSDSSGDDSDRPARKEVGKKHKKESRVDKSWVEGPFAHEKRRRKEKTKKDKKKTSHKDRKEKKKKGRKSSPTPSRSPGRDKRRRPPSSDSTDGGKKKSRDGAAKRGAPRTLVIRL
eukprot:s1836_g7.t1